MFLLDASQGVRPDDYKREKEFVKSQASHFNINPAGARGIVIVYGNQSSVVRFNDLQFEKRIDSAPFLGTPRRTDRAIALATQILQTSRPDTRKIVIVMMAGQQTPGARPLGDFTEPLRKLGAQRFVIVIGNEPRDRDLLPLVDGLKDIIRLTSFEGLSLQSRTISKKIRDKPGES